jgi:uncharacterized protein (DUF2062 family)
VTSAARAPRSEGRAPRVFLRRAIGVLLYERCSPLELGAGVAVGTIVGMTPFYGLHLCLAVALAALLRVNMAGAALATQISNPLFAPVLVLASVRVGTLLGVGAAAAPIGPLGGGPGFLRAWMVGGVILGAGAGLVLGAAAGGIRALFLSRSRAAGAPGRP